MTSSFISLCSARLRSEGDEVRKGNSISLFLLGPYRFFFYAGDRQEPAHIHIERDENVAKFWLDPVRLQSSGGFSRPEIHKIQKLVAQNAELLLRGWNEYFDS